VKLQVIVPARNEERNVPYFYERARAGLDRLDLDWNIVFLNNASADGSLEEMLKLRARDPRVKVITMSRDFGYHAALVAGLSMLEGDYYAIVDVDCEDPPELVVDFYKALREGAEVAYGVRSNRDEPRLVTFGRRLFYVANRGVADSEIVMWMGEFAMMTRQVRDALVAPRTTFPFIRAEMGYVGFARTGVPYQRARRVHGQSHYNLWRMSRFAIAGILSGSTFPLRFVLYLAAFLGAAFPLAVAALGLSADAATRVAVFVGLYFLLVSVPFIALYLARAYKNGVARPVFVVDRTKTYLE
jgi:dolichol-phosphate mannosyltransferase